MWKENISRDSAINIIKNKRKCVDINLGFLFQLSKWEEFNNQKENKLFIFNNNGNISLLGINDFIDVIFNEKVSIVIVLHNNKIYKIYNGALMISSTIEEKINNFINFLKIYKNYPSIVESFVYVNEENIKLKTLLEYNLLEEIIRYCESF